MTHRLAREYSLKALSASPSNRSLSAIGKVRSTQEKAFTAGLEAIIAIMDLQVDRICTGIESSRERQSDYDRGLVEGVRWLKQAVEQEVEHGEG